MAQKKPASVSGSYHSNEKIISLEFSALSGKRCDPLKQKKANFS